MILHVELISPCLKNGHPVSYSLQLVLVILFILLACQRTGFSTFQKKAYQDAHLQTVLCKGLCSQTLGCRCRGQVRREETAHENILPKEHCNMHPKVTACS